MKKVKHLFWSLLLFSMILDIEVNGNVEPFKEIVNTINIEALQEPESKLYYKLLSSYNKKVRPVLNATDAVHVNVSVTLANVMGVDVKYQSLTTLLWIGTEWSDPLLAWNETEHPGIKYLAIQADEIWTPDLMVCSTFASMTLSENVTLLQTCTENTSCSKHAPKIHSQ